MTTTHTESGSVHDDVYMSEDSESTQGSDLDYDITIDVLLPDNTVQKTTIAASTAWSDLRTQLCSQFKLSPSSHVVEFISNSTSNKKRRKASLAVGKMDVSMITIKAKKANGKSVITPHPASSSKENTVRLIVRLARLRQSIIRVNPDVPLSDIFETICEKLKLKADAKNRVEFRHPQQIDVKLNPELTLNHYKLREVHLAEKIDTGNVKSSKPSPHLRTKRKAPAPPRPAPPHPAPPRPAPPHPTPRVAEQRKMPPQKEPEPIYAKIQKQPKPAKRRAAPRPPQTPPSIDKQSSVEDQTDKESLVSELNKNVGGVSVEELNKATGEIDKIIDEELSQESHEDESDEDVIIQSPSVPSDDVINDDVTDNVTKEVNHVIDEVTDEHENDDIFDEVTDEHENDDIIDEVTDEHDIDEVTDEHEIDDVINDATSDDITKKEDEPSDNITPDDVSGICEVTDDVIVDETDDEIIMESDDITATSDYDVIKNDVEHDKDQPNVLKYGDITVYDVIDDDVTDAEKLGNLEFENLTTETSTDDVEEIENPKTSDDFEIDLDDLPPPPLSLFDDFDLFPSIVESVVMPLDDDKEKFVIDELSSFPRNSEPDFHDNKITTTTNGDGFDLHIAESFNIPIETIDEKHETSNDDVTQVDQNDNKIDLNKEIKTEEISETDKTALEIEKLHLQIKKMKNRNSMKQTKTDQYQMLKDTNSNTWHPGTKSFTFIPNRKIETSHIDYDVAPVGGIELSNSGEIKNLHDEQNNKPEVKIEQATPKLRSTLPSYYKKFLGVSAFASKQQSK